MLAPIRRARHLRRYQKIITVLAQHGFGSLLEALQAHRYLPVPPVVLRQRGRENHLSPAEHLRLALEELGPTFIKLGQILSTRPDLIPPAYIVELSKLRDSVPPSPFETVRAQLRREYGREPEEIFTHIDPEPLGSASLAQVHAAVLADGREVAVKIQRPDITATINADLDILADVAGLAKRSPWGQLFDPVGIIEHFGFTLRNELDYRQEGLNADRFRSNFEGQPYLHIPKIYWEHSTPHVLVMERLKGVKIDDLEGLSAAGHDRQEVARKAAAVIAKEIMEDGFFHADPHPGNFVILDGGVIGAMDFGMVGHISKNDRLNILQAYEMAIRQDSKRMVEHMLRMGALSASTDLQGLERDIDRLLGQYRDLPMKFIQAQRVIEEMMDLAFRYRISLPPDLWLLVKTVVMMDGLARMLDPDFVLFNVFTPHVRRILLETRLPWSFGPALMEDLEGFAQALKDVPNIGEGLLRGLQRGELPLSVSMGASKETLDRLDRISTRFSLSLLAAAFIVGLALLVPVASGSQAALILVVVGFMVALGLGGWLAFSIIRAGK